MRVAQFTVAAVVAVFLGGLTAWLNHSIPMVAAQSGRTPCQTTYVTKSYRGDGTETRSQSSIVAIRADGSTVIQHLRTVSVDGSTRVLTRREIADVALRRDVTLFPEVQAKISSQLEDASVMRLQAKPEPGCRGASPDPNLRMILGHDVLKRETSQEAANGRKIEQREWLAPGVDCLLLRSEAVLKDAASGAVLGRETREAAQVTVGPPDAALFEVPAGFAEMSPSEVMAAEAKLMGVACSACDTAVGQRADQRYRQARRPLR